MSMTTAEFDRLWQPVKDTACSDNDKVKVQNLVIHIIGEHQELFGFNQSKESQLYGFRFECSYFEREYEDVLTIGGGISSLAYPSVVSQGSIDYAEGQGMYYALTSGNMKIVDFRSNLYSPDVVIHWGAISGLERDLDFRMLMHIRSGRNCDGFQTVSELLIALKQFDMIADIVDSGLRQATRNEILSKHWIHFGQARFDSSCTFRISPDSIPEVEYAVTPMWSMDRCFDSIAELTSFLQLSKPVFQPKSAGSVPSYYGHLPRGNGDYLISHDSNKSEWALLYSPRLGLYYKVFVQITGTAFDQSRSLTNAHLVCSEPTKHYKPRPNEATVNEIHTGQSTHYGEDPHMPANKPL